MNKQHFFSPREYLELWFGETQTFLLLFSQSLDSSTFISSEVISAYLRKYVEIRIVDHINCPSWF